MFPSGFEPCFLLEEGVGDGQGVFCAQFEEQPPVVVAVADSMPPKHSWPNGVVSAYLCIKSPMMKTLSVSLVFCRRDLSSL